MEQWFSVMYFDVGIFYFDLDKVLMDIGALHSSYISRDLVDKHRDAWRGKVMHVDGKDCLGDNKTEVSVTKNVKIDVLLQSPDQQRVTAIETMCGPTSSLSPDVNSFRIFNMIRREQLDSSSSRRWTLRKHFIRYQWRNIPATCFR